MDFTLTTEQKALRDALRDMLGRREPNDRVGKPSFDAELWGALAEMGLLALPWESDPGDPDSPGPVEVMVVAQELGRARAVAPYAEMLVAGHLLGDDPLLEQVGSGDAVVVPALTEPGKAWGVAPTATARQEGEEWLLDGTKGPVPYADGATHALAATTSGVFVVEGPKVEDSVLRLSATPARLVTDGAGRVDAAVTHGSLALCAEALGAMESALALTVDYLKSRKQFGVPLMTFQSLTQRAAVMYTEVELARSAVQYAAMVLAEPQPGEDAGPTLARTSVVVGKAGKLVGEEAVQLHGGIGVTEEYAVGHLLNRLTAIEHTFGDTRHHLGRLARRVDDHDVVEVV
jgi:alkylation response protein AidB-like acyl-CoA dehydrogenase